MGVDGHFDGAVITLFVTVAIDLSGAHINGIIGEVSQGASAVLIEAVAIGQRRQTSARQEIGV